MHAISTDTRLGVATTLGSAVAAMCVQLVDASGNLAIHMPTRILLRSSSTHEPSDPPLEVVSLQASPPTAASPHIHVGKPQQAPPQAVKNIGVERFLWHARRHPTPPPALRTTPKRGGLPAANSTGHQQATRRTPAADKREAGSLD